MSQSNLPNGRRKPLMLALLILLPMLILALPRWWAGWRFASQIRSVDGAPRASAAIVFGAGLRRDGRPTSVLADRVRTAAELYQRGKVPELVMSGSVRQGYDEPASMQALALTLGVPQNAIIQDPAGDRTFDTCLGARQRFPTDQVILVSQAYHLPRALATCAGLGLRATGVSADLRTYRPAISQFWLLREFPATLVALLDTYLIPHPQPPEQPQSQTVERTPPHGS
jgi:SanA protein